MAVEGCVSFGTGERGGVTMTNSQLGNSNTASESLFELYLAENGYTEWTHEQTTPSKPTTPDYRVRFGGGDLYFEVKEFESDDLVQAAARGAYDPYHPLREKVNQAARQFKHSSSSHAPSCCPTRMRRVLTSTKLRS